MYGSELWNLNCSYVDDFKVAWRKVKRRIWKLPCNTHNAIVKNLTYNIDHQLDVRIAKFTHMCLNHQNDVCPVYCSIDTNACQYVRIKKLLLYHIFFNGGG